MAITQFTTFTTTGAGSAVFTAPPSNGHIVAAVSTAGGASAGTFSDSHAVSYTLEQSFTGQGGDTAAIWDKVVSGSPSATYSLSAQAVGTAYELSGYTLVGAQYANNQGSLSAVVTLSGLHVGDVILVGMRAFGSGFVSLVCTNGTLVQTFTNSDSQEYYAIATLTGLAVITLTMTSVGYLNVATYPASASSPSFAKITPFMGEYPGGMPGMP